MSARHHLIRNARYFDGATLTGPATAQFDGDDFAGAFGTDHHLQGAAEIDLGGDILFAGYVDLQVNGGDGILFNSAPHCDGLRRIAKAHRRLGTTAFLPTLITDTPEVTRAAIAATQDAVAAQVDGIAGLHLEGPHLSLARKGAHAGGLIRPMTEQDLALYLDAAASLPCLKLTIAPENVTEDQVAQLARARVILSLGHTDADYDTCLRYFKAGVRATTHLFNAMSQLNSRAPGLVGATLGTGSVSAGVIADGVHVHPQSLRAAWDAKKGPCGLFLVTDAMAVAGSDITEFDLGGRRITRKNGVLTLADGTLAGADLDLTRAVQVMVENVGIPLIEALRAATSIPAALIGLRYGQGGLPRMMRLSTDTWTLTPLEKDLT
ncbi:MAG: N-acetylglucosamine-6-phosphate deacetylase [Rhodobacteraceae bacterium]|jgi:N-acetylglucosamine-6-phosphate deacetylase|nr:N-acetylglucosamine-6-phosphate deacetylase [Paracoccaceae bacterium]QPI85582.1 N-acetylglucosamine-6-phosphate deacetylase [Rhodobacterales bacterium HKCCA1288]